MYLLTYPVAAWELTGSSIYAHSRAAILFTRRAQIIQDYHYLELIYKSIILASYTVLLYKKIFACTKKYLPVLTLWKFPK